MKYTKQAGENLRSSSSYFLLTLQKNQSVIFVLTPNTLNIAGSLDHNLPFDKVVSDGPSDHGGEKESRLRKL